MHANFTRLFTKLSTKAYKYGTLPATGFSKHRLETNLRTINSNNYFNMLIAFHLGKKVSSTSVSP